MLIGIRPINDFAFKKTFGSPENKLALISLLNSILGLPKPIVDVTIENPYNLQDFKDDKLSILDIKAIDQTGAIYDVEMQLSIFTGLIQRIVFYGCEIYNCFLRKQYAKRRRPSPRSHKLRRIKPCTIHEKKQSATGNGN